MSENGKIDSKFMAPFILEAVFVIKGTCQTDSQKEAVYLKKVDEPSGDVSSLIAMNSSKFKGSMAISFEEKCFLGLVGAMFGETIPEMNDEIKDASSEICNQIFARSRKTLNEQGHDIGPAIPSVITGKNHTVKHLVQGPCVAVRFKTQYGLFLIEAVVESVESIPLKAAS